jgi:hypothetical protein
LTGLQIDGIPAGRYVLRMFWVAIRLLLVIYLGQAGVQFFYQGF